MEATDEREPLDGLDHRQVLDQQLPASRIQGTSARETIKFNSPPWRGQQKLGVEQPGEAPVHRPV